MLRKPLSGRSVRSAEQRWKWTRLFKTCAISCLTCVCKSVTSVPAALGGKLLVAARQKQQRSWCFLREGCWGMARSVWLKPSHKSWMPVWCQLASIPTGRRRGGHWWKQDSGGIRTEWQKVKQDVGVEQTTVKSHVWGNDEAMLWEFHTKSISASVFFFFAIQNKMSTCSVTEIKSEKMIEQTLPSMIHTTALLGVCFQAQPLKHD